MQTATQPLEAPGARTATQPVQAPGSVPDGQPTGEGDLSAVSDSEADQLSVTGSWMMRSTGTGHQTGMSPGMRLTRNLLRRPIIERL